LKFGGRAEFGAFDPMTAEHIQAYLGHKKIQHAQGFLARLSSAGAIKRRD
jgi:hypothetical protein